MASGSITPIYGPGSRKIQMSDGQRPVAPNRQPTDSKSRQNPFRQQRSSSPPNQIGHDRTHSDQLRHQLPTTEHNSLSVANQSAITIQHGLPQQTAQIQCCSQKSKSMAVSSPLSKLGENPPKQPLLSS
ncbi:hypothetical protein ACLOJK_014878 [Asimina triloba]